MNDLELDGNSVLAGFRDVVQRLSADIPMWQEWIDNGAYDTETTNMFLSELSKLDITVEEANEYAAARLRSQELRNRWEEVFGD